MVIVALININIWVYSVLSFNTVVYDELSFALAKNQQNSNA